MTVYYFMLCFFVYGFAGWCTEVAFAAAKSHRFVNRGFLNGPICPIYGIGVGVVIQFLSPFKSSLILLYVTSVIVVTALEWLTGFILEKVFHNKWWDYSNMPLNLNGYVCLLFSLIWGVACVLIVDFLHPLVDKVLRMLPHVAGIILLVILGIALFADLYVTVSGILKLNKRLESMEAIAQELHNISEQLGENIYKGMTETMEMQEEAKQKLDEVTQIPKAKLEEIKEQREKFEKISEETRERVRSLKIRYKELSSAGQSKVHKRLINAFPKMKSSRYSEALKDLQEALTRRKNKKK